MIALWGQWVYVSHWHACSVLKVKLANIKLLFINFETVTTDENNSIKKQFFQTVTVCVYINTAKIIDGKCNNPSQSQHDVACFTTIPNIQLMIPVTNAIHVCKHTKISLHICIHALYTKSFGMCIEGKNLKGTLDLWTLISTLVMTQSSAVLKRERVRKKRKRGVINQNLQNAFMISPWTCYLQIFLSVCFLNN